MRWLIRTFFRGLRIVLGPFMLLWEILSRGKGVERAPEAQAEVDRQCRDLAMYQFRTCPFSIRARKEIHRLSLKIELRDARDNAEHRATLLREGGKIKVPCLRITGEEGQDQWLYESDAVIDYLRQRFAH